MTPFAAESFTRLAKAIDESKTEATDHLCAGGAQDYADYRERAGYLRALKDITENMQRIESELNQGK